MNVTIELLSAPVSALAQIRDLLETLKAEYPAIKIHLESDL